MLAPLRVTLPAVDLLAPTAPSSTAPTLPDCRSKAVPVLVSVPLTMLAPPVSCTPVTVWLKVPRSSVPPLTARPLPLPMRSAAASTAVPAPDLVRVPAPPLTALVSVRVLLASTSSVPPPAPSVTGLLRLRSALTLSVPPLSVRLLPPMLASVAMLSRPPVTVVPAAYVFVLVRKTVPVPAPTATWPLPLASAMTLATVRPLPPLDRFSVLLLPSVSVPPL